MAAERNVVADPRESFSAPSLTPEEEYRKAGKSRRKRSAFTFLLMVVGFALCAVLLTVLNAEDLPYRVVRQVENGLTGKNVFQTGEYLGDTDFGYFAGDGIFDYRSGTTYEGQWSDNFMEGYGELQIPEEGVYKGEFSGSRKNGKGTFTWYDGAVYVGEWEADQMSGQGVYTGSDGLEFSGTFKANSFWQGLCAFSNSFGEYEVEYRNGEIDNLKAVFLDGTTYDGACDDEFVATIGTMSFSNGDKYIGSFEDGKRSGQGIYQWSNGDKYEGSWAKDEMSGSGVYAYSNGSSSSGKFADGKFIEGTYRVSNSFGEYVFAIEEGEPVSVEMALFSGTKCSGEMEDGKLTGDVQISYSNGDKYSGSVVDGEKSGQGSYTWSNGASYEGDWGDDKMSGQGVYYYPESGAGYKVTGSFVDGAPSGECWYYVTSSESYKTDWEDGKCVKIYE